jgi:hypothetical protein
VISSLTFSGPSVSGDQRSRQGRGSGPSELVREFGTNPAVPGGTVYRVEADSGNAAYEAHMTKADGTEVTVKFDSSNNVTGVEVGIGK